MTMESQRRATPSIGALSPRPLDKRNRRQSAPGGPMPMASTPGARSSQCSLRKWVTTSSAAWRTAPSAMGFKIDTLPRGWQVTEAPWTEEAVAGWVPIEPRGFLQLCDVAKAPELEEEMLPVMSMSPAPSSSIGSPGPGSSASCSSPQEASSTRSALLALREEHVRLREANVQLREREIKKRHEIDNLCRAREFAAKELAKAKEELAAEREEIERSRQQRRALQQKLDRCREAVATAVGSIDCIYSQQPEDSPLELSGDEEGPVIARARQQRRSKASELVEQATAAGAVVSEMIDELAKPDEDNSDLLAYDKYCSSQENAEVSTTPAVKKAEMKATHSPAHEKFSGDQRAPLRDLNIGR
eukprot:gb/GFBE01021932.1/.p1 GENE.gb/GFBE01021932.1/~~gb/GFBE01021932.1/.p1  ORF type:complete len:359 (+),score=89.13 gb/GFBE01021932.1/:1-1077(+)